MSEQIKDGGPAFPTGEKLDPKDGRIEQYMVPGMSLRDYFAAAAMQGLVAQLNGTAMSSDIHCGANWAYQMADEMLRRRGYERP